MKNNFKRFISVFLAIALFAGVAAVPAVADENDGQYNCYFEQVYNEGYQPLTTEEFLGFFDTVNNIFETVIGVTVFPEEKMKVTIEGCLVDVFDDMKQNSVLDCAAIANSLPSLAASSRKINELLRLDTEQVTKVLNEKISELNSQGKVTQGRILSFVRAYLQIIEECVIYSQPEQGSDTLHDIYFKIIYGDGSEEIFRTGIVYDAEAQLLYDDDGKGVLGLGFNLDTDTNTLYTTVDSWQRNFGFCLFYDIFCYCTNFMDYTTKRVKFNYDGKEWMIQIWKGRYFITAGAEIGIYSRPVGSKGSYYDCASDDEMLVMGLELYRGDNLILKREPELHWWVTGFKIGQKAYIPQSLTIHGYIEFPDEEMASLFEASAKKERIKVKRDASTVSFIW